MNKREIGIKYEESAARYLEDRGYTIEQRNYRNRYGEIDIIAKKERTWVFCEIKYRSSAMCGDPSEAVDYRKQKKICRTAFCFYASHGFTEEVPCRFDVLSVYADGSIVHLENAFGFCV